MENIPFGFTEIENTTSTTVDAPAGFTALSPTMDYSDLEADIAAGRKPAWMLDWYKDRHNEFIKDRGSYEFDPEDIGPGFWETETGQTGGGIVAGIKGFQKGFSAAPPVAPIVGPFSKPAAGIVVGAISAYGGGAVGEGGQQIWQEVTGNPYAPENWEDTVQRMHDAGKEEFMYDVVGNLFFVGGGSAYRFIRPKEVPGVGNVQKILESHGGTLSAAQRTDHSIIRNIEGLVEESWGGKPLRELREINDDAIISYTNDYVKRFGDLAGSELTDEGVGRLFIGMIESGQKAHSNTASTLYSKLDDLYTAQKTQKTVSTPTGLVDTSGSIISKTKTIETIVPPVPTEGIKKIVNRVLKLQGELSGATMGDYGAKIVNSLSKISDEGLSFAAAQELRSSLLANLRGVGGKLGEGKTKGLMKQLVSAIDEAIETGAKKTGNTEFINSWQSANKFWREGKDVLETKVLSTLLKKDPEKIGETIFSVGNVTKIKAARKAVQKAVEYSQGAGTKGLTKAQAKEAEMVFSTTWKKMQAGYLTSIIGKVANPETGELSIRTLKKFFQPGTKHNRTLKEAFTKSQRDGLKEFVDSVAIMQSRPKSAGKFMVTVQQANLVMTAYSGYHFAQDGEIPYGEISLFTITPFILSKLLINPRYAKLISRGSKMKVGQRGYGAVTAKIMAAVADVQAVSDPKKKENKNL